MTAAAKDITTKSDTSPVPTSTTSASAPASVSADISVEATAAAAVPAVISKSPAKSTIKEAKEPKESAKESKGSKDAPPVKTSNAASPANPQAAAKVEKVPTKTKKKVGGAKAKKEPKTSNRNTNAKKAPSLASKKASKSTKSTVLAGANATAPTVAEAATWDPWEDALSRSDGPAWSLADFDIGQKLGEGQFGTVYLARERRSNFIVALKSIKKCKLLVAGSHHLLRREIEVHSNLLHPNILQFFGWFVTDAKIWLILEICPSGELLEKIINGGLKTSSGKIDERKVSLCMRQMIDAIHHCHKTNTLHRDIKPENILIDVKGNLKLADFGWSIHVPNLHSMANPSGTEDTASSKTATAEENSARYMTRRRKTYCGTLDYLSPEICRNEWYGKEVDLWCLGVLCFEIATGGPPFPHEPYLTIGLSESEARHKQQDEIQRGDIEKKLTNRKDMSNELKDFLRKTLAKEPERRFNTIQMLRHPFIRDHNQDIKEEMLDRMEQEEIDMAFRLIAPAEN